MSETTKIEWCAHTFNPWIGCQRVSPGCENCYAEKMTNARPHFVLGPGVPRVQGGEKLKVWGPLAPRRVTSADNWSKVLRWNEAAKQGDRPRVFCASLADVFEDFNGVVTGTERDWLKPGATLDDARKALWALVEMTTNLDWLLLTKRPQNVLRMVESGRGWLGARGWPPNVWIGTTCEDQQRADERLPHLLQIPAPVRFVSYEPALGPVDFSRWLHAGRCKAVGPSQGRCGLREHDGSDHTVLTPSGVPWFGQDRGLDWIIVGGESGPGARPFDLAWARKTVADCKAAGVACFVKQMGSYHYDHDSDGRVAGIRRPGPCGNGPRDRKGGDMAEWPEDLRVREFPEVSRG